MTAPDRAAIEADIEAVKQFAAAWRTRTEAYANSATPQALHVARVPDGEHVSMTEPQLSTALAELERLTDRVAHLDSARDSAVRAWKQEHDGADELQRERDTARSEVARAWEDLTGVREERDGAAARVAELESEREADTRAVAALRDALRAGGRGWSETDALTVRFADRIDDLAARDEQEAGQ
jgi:chromosome segregation ATPase